MAGEDLSYASGMPVPIPFRLTPISAILSMVSGPVWPCSGPGVDMWSGSDKTAMG